MDNGDRGDDGQARIDPAFRSGTMPAVGILLGFSLTFLLQWADGDLDWDAWDLLAIAPLTAGILMQFRAVTLLLSRDSLIARHYDRARRIFVRGLLSTCIGAAIAIVLNVLEDIPELPM